MTTADKIANLLRTISPEGKLKTEDIPLINQLGRNWDARRPAIAVVGDPKWVAHLRSKLGQREIKGANHNLWIAAGWKRLGVGWFNDDETPWCGFAVADALDAAGLPYPKNFPAASSFKTHGTDCAARLGAIGVKARKGGNHVFLIVGETPDKLFYKALGGNQGDAVSIVDIRKTDVDAIRWPAGAPLPTAIYLPVLPKGTISGKEA